MPRQKRRWNPRILLGGWIAENWWVLLFEPRKDEEERNYFEYLTRHSILVAQHGFPLPDLSIVPFGRSFRLNSRPRRAQFAEHSFATSAFADVSRDEVEQVLSTFVSDVVERLATVEFHHSTSSGSME